MDKKIIKNIEKCSRCGLCMDICPVYEAKKAETFVSRGKFLQLFGLIKGDLKFDKNIKYNLDLCLSCKKCKKACPSDIDAVEIFASIKNNYQTPIDKFLNSYPFFKLKMLALKTFYKVKSPFKKKQKTINNIAHFSGCVEYATGNYKKEKFKCCGLPFYIKGNFDLYEKLKNKNIELINKYDRVVFTCATCFDTVSSYENIDKNKLIYFTDFYLEKKLTSPEKLKVTFHKPCHLPDDEFQKIENILSNIKNVEYVKLENYDDCCGFGGDFFTRHIKTSNYLSIKKIEHVFKTNADIVLTACPTCLWSLKYGIKAKSYKALKAYDLAHFLNIIDSNNP